MDLDSNENNLEENRENETTALQTKQQKAEQAGAVPLTVSNDISCGYGACCHPLWLQVFNSAKWFLAFMCAFVLLQSILSFGYLISVLSTIEKRYGLNSAETRLILLSDDIGSILFVVFISYFEGKGHRPRWIGISAVFVAIGAGLFSTPQYFSSPYDIPKLASIENVQEHLCLNQSVTNSSLDKTQCEAQKANSFYIFLFVIANMLMGISATLIYPLGVTFLYDNVERHTASLYIAFMYIMAGVGPAIGYVLGAVMLGYYVDPGVEGVPSSDPRFIGAWWTGYILVGALIFATAIPLLGYPQTLRSQSSGSMNVETPGTPVTDDKVKNEVTNACTTFGRALKDLLRAFISLITNPTYVCITVILTLEYSIVAIFVKLIPKNIQMQFGIGPSLATILTGVVLLPSLTIGTSIGGYVIKRFKLNKLGCARVGLISILSATFMFFAFLIHCPSSDVMGIADDSCLNCNCESTLYNPICLKNVTFYNPCTAGCSDVLMHDNGTHIEPITYTGCDCSGLNITATQGICERDCTQTLILFMVCLFFIIMTTGVALIPAVISTLRCVEYNERAFAIGLQTVFYRTLGFVPAPIYYRSAIDRACLIWVGSTDACEGGFDVCQVYDADLFRYIFVGLFFGLKILSLILMSITWYFIRKKSMQRNRKRIKGKAKYRKGNRKKDKFET